MESSRSLRHLAEYDDFFFGWLDDSARHSPPSLDHLVHGVGHSFQISTSSSFIDLYPRDDLFSIDLTTAASDFDFDLPVVDDAAPSPMMPQISASRLLPCEPGGGSGAQEDGDESVSVITSRYHHSADAPSAPWLSAFSSPVSHSARSTLVSLSACSIATSKHARPRPAALCAGRRRAGSSPWKVLRFLMPLYRKVRAIARRHSRFTLARGATSSVAYHGRADTDVHDVILYCKKSSGSGVQETNRMSAT
ncbi:hypothetical protein CFC21_068959 [Triticum aestivum]|uniref:Membrane-associated kinase regulator 6 n=2 Tax=Triticum aestivum TaxID=4565 RepID=A0A9R1KQ95_WHEAT|nr:uncharacterized protein LOC123108372 [Triticum aestivum]KAF7062350.1 hypothetical protein CFC21_068959 [Triticum aestivum]